MAILKISERVAELARDIERSPEAIVVQVQGEYPHHCCARSYVLRIIKRTRRDPE